MKNVLGRFKSLIEANKSIRDEQELNELYKRVFSTKDGQRVLKHLCNYVKPPNITLSEPYSVMFHEGAREIIQMILTKASGDAFEVQKLYAENYIYRKTKEEKERLQESKAQFE